MGPLSSNVGPIDDLAKQRYLEEEKERLRQFEEQRRRQIQQKPSEDSTTGNQILGLLYNQHSIK